MPIKITEYFQCPFIPLFRTPENSERPLDMAKERILAVDDEEDILELVRFNLAREGYHVICAIITNC